MKKNSFTLIELLAVIIILAMVALIATPVVLNIIEDTKNEANMRTVDGLIDGGRQYCANAMFDTTAKDNITNVRNVYDSIIVSGSKPDKGEIYVNDKCQVAIKLVQNKKCYTKFFDGQIAVKEEVSCTEFVGKDDVIPTVDLELVSGTINDLGWSKDDLKIKVIVKDNESGPSHYKWCSDVSNCMPTSTVNGDAGIVDIKAEGDNKICVIGYDKSGKESGLICSTIYKLDKTKPSIEGIADITIRKDEVADLTTGVTANDSLSGIKDNYDYNPKSVDTSKAGMTNITYTISDKAGNTTEITRKVIVDSEAPTITYTPLGDKINDKGWAKENFIVQVDLVDNSGLGIKEGKWCSTNLDTCTPNATISGTTLTPQISLEGNTRICVEATDNNNKTSQVICSNNYKLDKTKPVISGLSDIKLNIGDSIDLSNGILANDTLSGINGNFTYLPTSVNTLTVGITKITYKVTDIAGNEIVAERTVEVLGSAPSITFSTTTSPNSNNWFNTDFYVKGVITDNSNKGIKSIKWCSSIVDCTPISTVTGEVNVKISTESIANKVCIEAIDNNDKKTILCSNNYSLDKTKPTIEGIVDINVWKGGTVDLTSGITVTDSLSTVNGSYDYNPKSVDTSKAGTTNITYTVSDKAGNSNEVARKVIVDAAAPTIAYTPLGDKINAAGWAKENFIVQVNLIDNSDLGIKEGKWCSSNTTSTCIPNAVITGTTLTPQISLEGSNRICVQATDNNNKSSEISCSNIYKLDKTAPVTYNDFRKADGSTYNNDVWTNQDVIQTVSGTDNLSGIAKYQITYEGINFIDLSSLVINYNVTRRTGVWTRAIDQAGNVGLLTPTFLIAVDKGVPSIWAKPDNVSVIQGSNIDLSTYFNVSFPFSGGYVSCNPANDSLLAPGYQTVTCTAIANNGATASATKSISVYANVNITNLVKNGGNETSTDWGLIDASYSTDFAYEGTRSIKLSKASESIVRQNTIKPVYGHKYYGRTMVLTNHEYTVIDARFELYCMFVNDAPGSTMTFANKSIKTNTWTMLSSIQTLINSNYVSNGYWTVRNFTVYGSHDIYTDNAMIIDLTATFGAGNEPSQEWCDKNIPFFEGTKLLSELK